MTPKICPWVELSPKDYFRYLTGRRNVRCGMHLVREMSVGHLPGGENVRRGCFWSGMCLVGDVSGWGNVRRGCVWSGKCLSAMCPGISERALNTLARLYSKCFLINSLPSILAVFESTTSHHLHRRFVSPLLRKLLSTYQVIHLK